MFCTDFQRPSFVEGCAFRGSLEISVEHLNTHLNGHQQFHCSRWLLRQVLRFLTAAGVPQSETNVVGGTTGPSATLLLESLQEAAYHSPHDPIASHFLRPVLTPAFQVKLGRRITLSEVIEFPWQGLSLRNRNIVRVPFFCSCGR